MLIKKMLRTAWSYKAQFISMVLMVMLGVGVFVGFNMEWTSIEHNMFAFFDQSNFADYRLVNEKGYSQEDLEKIRSIEGVRAASRFLTVNADVKDSGGDSAALAVTTDFDVSSFVVIKGGAYDPNSADGIWLSDRYAEQNGISVGDELSFVYRNTEITGKVAGLIKAAEQMICVRDKTQLMPDFATHGYAYISPVFYESALGYGYYPQINVLSELDKQDFSDRVNSALGQTTVILTKEDTPALHLVCLFSCRFGNGAGRGYGLCDSVVYNESGRYDGYISGPAPMEPGVPVVLRRCGRCHCACADPYRLFVRAADAGRYGGGRAQAVYSQKGQTHGYRAHKAFSSAAVRYALEYARYCA